jgi:ubiquinone/menaquinone biosynthesis C-methylase UbiE
VTEDATQIPAWLRARAEAQARHPLVRRPALRNRFASFAGVKRSDTVLDLGCGAGYSSFALARRAQQVSALDWRPELLAAAEKEAKRRRLTNIAFVEAEPDRLPYPHDSFDVVASAAAFHHLPKPSTAVSELSRVCRTEGTIAIEDVVASEQEIRAR